MTTIYNLNPSDKPFRELHFWQWLESQAQVVDNYIETLREYLTQCNYQGIPLGEPPAAVLREFSPWSISVFRDVFEMYWRHCHTKAANPRAAYPYEPAHVWTPLPHSNFVKESKPC